AGGWGVGGGGGRGGRVGPRRGGRARGRPRVPGAARPPGRDRSHRRGRRADHMACTNRPTVGVMRALRAIACLQGPPTVLVATESGRLPASERRAREQREGGAGSRSEAMGGERVGSVRGPKGRARPERGARSRVEGKASGLGAYERGERAISVPRLLRLAEIYQVPGDQLLPRTTDVDADFTHRDGAFEESFTIDLERLRDLDDAEASVLSRYAKTIQLQRQDFNGRLLTIRRDDLRVLAAVLGRRAEELARRLDELGLRAES